MDVEVSGGPRSMTCSFFAKMKFPRIKFMHWFSRRNTVSSKPRESNCNVNFVLSELH